MKSPRPLRYDLYYVAIKKQDNRENGKGLTPKFWNGAEKDYYQNPTLPWKCDRCEKRFKYKNQVKDHKLEDHAY